MEKITFTLEITAEEIAHKKNVTLLTAGKILQAINNDKQAIYDDLYDLINHITNDEEGQYSQAPDADYFEE